MNMPGIEKGFFGIQDVFDMPDMAVMDTSHHRDAAHALVKCINTHGSINPPWMAEASGLSVWELVDALKGAIFQDP